MAGQRRRRPTAGADDGEGMAAEPAPVTRIKVLSMGALGSGKSCVIKRFCEGRFVQKYISTIGVDYGVKPARVGEREVKVNFFDLSGHPQMFEIRNEFYRDSQGAILVFDVGSRPSFDELDDWLEEARRFGVREIPIALCGNKCDRRRAVSEDEARAWAEENGCSYFDVSAQSGLNVSEVFEWLFESVVERVAPAGRKDRR